MSCADRQVVRYTGGATFISWLFKTTQHSTDYRVGVFNDPTYGNHARGAGENKSPEKTRLGS